MINYTGAVTMQELGCSGMQIAEYSNGFLTASQLNCNYHGSCEAVNNYISKEEIQVGILICLDKNGLSHTYVGGSDFTVKIEDKARVSNVTIGNDTFSINKGNISDKELQGLTDFLDKKLDEQSTKLAKSFNETLTKQLDETKKGVWKERGWSFFIGIMVTIVVGVATFTYKKRKKINPYVKSKIELLVKKFNKRTSKKNSSTPTQST
jgi:hypothetical protein